MAAAKDDTLDSDSFGHSTEDQLQKRIFVSTFSMLAKLAGADGTVTKREVDLVERVMDEVLQLDAERKRFAIRVFNDARKSRTTFRDHCEEYRKLLADKPKMYEWMMDVLLRVALADEVYAGPEADALEVACSIFNISPERYAQLRSKYQKGNNDQSKSQKENNDQNKSEKGSSDQSKNQRGGSDQPYQVLGCAPGCPVEEIEQRYQKLSKDYDPARVLAANLPQEFVELAEQKSSAIKTAYVQIMRERGASKQ